VREENVSYATDPIAPGGSRPARPSSVTISSYLLYLVAGIQIIGTIIALVVAGDYQRVVKDAYADVDGGDAIASITSATLIGGAIFSLLVGIGLAVLAIFNNRGKNAARITTWVVGGIFLCCGGFGLISQAASGSMNFGGPTDPDAPSPEELQELLADALPSWYGAVTILLSVIGLLALLGALILLALPPSNEFFRKPQTEWQPPAGQPGYMAYPAYPPSAAPPGSAEQPPSAPAAPSAPSEEPPAPPPPAPGEPPADPPAGPARP
jgi:hypothetical protein